MKKPISPPTRIEIDLKAIRFNLGQVRKKVGPKTGILGMVKTDAYGHGIVETAKTLRDSGIDFLGVVAPGEGIFLRKKGIKVPILVFGSILSGEIEPVITHKLTPAITCWETAQALNKKAGTRKKIKVHLNVDTGMGRWGIWHKQALEFVKKLKRLKNLFLEGVYTHLAAADQKDKRFSHQQLARFSELLNSLAGLGIEVPYRHAANSAAILGLENSYFNLVRPGIMLYGAYPSEDVRHSLPLKPVLSLKTKIAYLKTVAKGRTIGYGVKFIARRPTIIGTIPLGYGDGYPRLLSNRAPCLVRGKRVPVVGAICMNETMVDLGRIRDIKIGEEVVLLGRQGKERISVEGLAKICGTIPNELLCQFSSHIRRVYK